MTKETIKPQLTKVAFARLQEEFDNLTTIGRKEMAGRLQRARELGDLSENAEYHETKNQQGMMEARIRQIEGMLREAEIVEAPTTADVAGAGTLVTLRPLDGDEPETYLLAASSEERAAAAERTVTLISPLGQAIVGKTVGDKVTYEAPKGTFSYEMIELKPWDGS